ncbi:MAG: HDOD domain-containing protein, partial [Proteocatella sp.]
INTVAYYRGGETTSTNVALSKLGLDEIRRWILLMMAKDFNKGKSDEIIKMALIRARFAEKIAKETSLSDRYYEAFMMGMFSLIDLIVEAEISEVLKDLPLDYEVKAAILGEQNMFGEILEFVKAYEDGQWEKICNKQDGFYLDVNTATNYYFECLVYADEIFRNM